MRKLILVSMAMVGLPLAAWAFQADVIAPPHGDFPVSVGGQLSFGLLNGEAKEHVYDYETVDGSRRQLSRLDWDLKDVVMGGVQFSVRPIQREVWDALTVNFGYWNALTEGSGEMEDFDWEYPNSEDYNLYSLSKVDVTDGYIFDLNAAWDVVEWKGLIVRGFLGYKQNGWSWEDQVQFGVYDGIYWDGQGENMINYEQEFRMPYLGASVDWTKGDFTVAGRLTYSPSVEATDWDEHVHRGMHYKEGFEGGDMLGFGLDVRYDFSRGPLKNAFLTAAFDVQTIDLIVGDMEMYGDETGGIVYKFDDAAGIENEYWVLSLGGGYRF